MHSSPNTDASVGGLGPFNENYKICKCQQILIRIKFHSQRAINNRGSKNEKHFSRCSSIFDIIIIILLINDIRFETMRSFNRR